MARKKGKEVFRQSVRKSTCQNEVLTIKRRRMFSRRAREYMLAYHAFNVVQDRQRSSSTTTQPQQSGGSEAPTARDGRPSVAAATMIKPEVKRETAIQHSHLEKVMKRKRTHRAMRDCDTRFLDEVLDVMESGPAVGMSEEGTKERTE